MSYQHRVLPSKVSTWGYSLLAVGLLGAVVGFVIDHQRAFFVYLWAFCFLMSIGLGAMFLLAIEYVTNAHWSTPIRRIVEFVASILPFVGLLAIPLAFGMHDLFHWTHHDVVAADPILEGKTPYLNVTFFWIRVVLFFGIWTVAHRVLFRNSVKQDASRDQRLTTFNVRISAVFIPIFAITLTLASIDWIMSLEPHWFSTIFGVYYFTGSFVTALAVITLVVVTLWEKGYLDTHLNRDHFYNLGGLMFAFTCFWSYIAFSQLLLIWYANLPEETFWFVNRWNGSWKYVSVALIIIRFIIPYFAMVSEDAKSNPTWLKIMAVWLLFAHGLDLYWLIMPTYSPNGAFFSWMFVAMAMVMVGLVIVVMARKANRYNLMPIGDPKLKKGLHFHL